MDKRGLRCLWGQSRRQVHCTQCSPFCFMEENQGCSSSRAPVGVSGASGSGVQDPLALVLNAISSSQLEMRKLRKEMRAAQEEAA